MNVGVLGGGQLGRMLALAGYPLGIAVSCFDRSSDVSAADVCTVVAGDLSDSELLHDWTAHVDVLTYEFESFPVELVADLAETTSAFPGAGPLAIAQDRWAEKRLFDESGIPIAPFRTVIDEAQLRQAIKELGFPVVAKTRTGGYDGKGQVVCRHDSDVERAMKLLSTSDLIVEQFIDFQSELSIIGVRGRNGQTAMYPLTENEHRNGILYASRVPSTAQSETVRQAQSYMATLLERLDYVGVLTLEMFLVEGRLLANEMAPRVHNSGHWTIEGSETSQFENHLRAITGLPLGGTGLRSPTAMLNLISTLPPINEVLAVVGSHLHLYGKSPRQDRKLGHVTVTGSDWNSVRQRLTAVENVVRRAENHSSQLIR